MVSRVVKIVFKVNLRFERDFTTVRILILDCCWTEQEIVQLGRKRDSFIARG